MNNDWIEWTWTEEKPYPETLETLVYTKHKCGIVYDGEGDEETVEWWHEEELLASNWYDDITHYKLA